MEDPAVDQSKPLAASALAPSWTLQLFTGMLVERSN